MRADLDVECHACTRRDKAVDARQAAVEDTIRARPSQYSAESSRTLLDHSEPFVIKRNMNDKISNV